jgi:Kazal-type serine protease inhibitor-like protein
MKPRNLQIFLAALILSSAWLAAPTLAQGSIFCYTNDNCRAGQFCAHLTGRCEHLGICYNQPQVCYTLHDPVCGCDGETYDNSCYAAQAGVSVAHLGDCGSRRCDRNGQCADGFYCERPMGACTATGVCEKEPVPCVTFMYQPVCGCDGRTYENGCLAGYNSVSVDHLGPCEAVSCNSSADCTVGTWCQKAAGSCGVAGQCTAYPQYCLDIYDPVCGCNSEVYGNSCYAAMEGMSVAQPGETCGIPD